MTTDPYRSVDKTPERQVWRMIGWIALAILALGLIWWVFALSGDAGERDPDDPNLEPLEPAMIVLPAIPGHR